MAAKYGGVYQRRRKAMLPMLRAGVACSRCGGLVIEGMPADLDHIDGDLAWAHGDLAWAHRSCNRSHGGKLGRAAQLAAAGKKPKPAQRPCCECGISFSPSVATTITCGRPVRRIAEGFPPGLGTRPVAACCFWARLVANRSAKEPS